MTIPCSINVEDICARTVANKTIVAQIGSILIKILNSSTVMYGRTYARTRRARDVRRAAAREATGGAEQADGQQAHDQISG